MRFVRTGPAGIVTGVALIVMVAACASFGASPGPSLAGTSPGPPLAGPPSSIAGTVTAGPVCPVEHNPPASGCTPRPVARAIVVVEDGQGREVARSTSAPDGRYRVAVGRAGAFTVSGLPVAGLMGLPRPVTVTLASDVGIVAQANLEYDTGIR
jgi:hypothetical protein